MGLIKSPETYWLIWVFFSSFPSKGTKHTMKQQVPCTCASAIPSLCVQQSTGSTRDSNMLNVLVMDGLQEI